MGEPRLTLDEISRLMEETSAGRIIWNGKDLKVVCQFLADRPECHAAFNAWVSKFEVEKAKRELGGV